MTDFLDVLAKDAIKTIGEGYYGSTPNAHAKHKPFSLTKSIRKFDHAPIIGEVKKASPSLGTIKDHLDVENIVSSMRRGGAIAVSILTEPKHFKGSKGALMMARKSVDLPILMKDIILSRAQIDMASAMGVDAILLIMTLFERGYCECDAVEMIQYAHSKDIEVLLEVHTEEEFVSSLSTDADLIGINNRDLKTLSVNINTTRRILGKIEAEGEIIVSESGIENPSDIRLLYGSGAQAFLVGSTLMRVDDIEGKVKELVMAL